MPGRTMNVLNEGSITAYRDALGKASIETGIHYPVPVHLQPAYAGRIAIGPTGLAETERASREILSLPLYPELTDADATAVVAAVRGL